MNVDTKLWTPQLHSAVLHQHEDSEGLFCMYTMIHEDTGFGTLFFSICTKNVMIQTICENIRRLDKVRQIQNDNEQLGHISLCRASGRHGHFHSPPNRNTHDAKCVGEGSVGHVQMGCVR